MKSQLVLELHYRGPAAKQQSVIQFDNAPVPPHLTTRIPSASSPRTAMVRQERSVRASETEFNTSCFSAASIRLLRG